MMYDNVHGERTHNSRTTDDLQNYSSRMPSNVCPRTTCAYIDLDFDFDVHKYTYTQEFMAVIPSFKVRTI